MPRSEENTYSATDASAICPVGSVAHGKARAAASVPTVPPARQRCKRAGLQESVVVSAMVTSSAGSKVSNNGKAGSSYATGTQS